MGKLRDKFFGEKLPKPTGRSHDFSSGNTWGWAFYTDKIIDGGLSIEGHGFGPRIRVGDWVILKNGKESTRYMVTSIEFTHDPGDMFFYKAVFAPRTERDPEPPKPSLADELIL